MLKKVLLVTLSLALMAGSVSLGIHLLHKDALAIVYMVKVWQADPEEGEIPIEGVQVDFYENEPFQQNYVGTDYTDETGKASFVFANPPEEWWVADITNNSWLIFIDPVNGIMWEDPEEGTTMLQVLDER